MQQLFVTESSTLEWRDAIPRHIEADSDVIVRPLAVARCDLDPAVIADRIQMPAPHEIGHEFVGEVIEIGSAVRSVSIGDRVVSSFAVSCGMCGSCGHAMHYRCDAVEKPAYYGFGALGHNWGGAVTDRMRIPFADQMLLRVPNNVTSVAASSAGDNLADAYRGVVPHLVDMPEAPVLVMGGNSPSIGLYAVAWAKRFGSSRVDYFDTDINRLALAERLGANVFEREAPEPGRTYPIAVHASGRANGLGQVLRAVDFGAHVTSSYIGAIDISIPFLQAFTVGVTLTMGNQNTRAHLPAVLSALADGFDPTGIIGTVYHWKNANEAFLESAAKIVVVRD